MSAEALSWAKQQQAGSASRKALLLLLADVAGEHGVLWAGVDYLASILECDRKTVMRALSDLEARGLLARVERRKPNGARAGTVTVLAPAVADRGAMRPFQEHALYGELLAENLSPTVGLGPESLSPILSEPKSHGGTRTNNEPESATDVADVKSARAREHPEAARLCAVLRDLMLANDPHARIPAPGTRARDRWVQDMSLLIQDRDGDVEVVERVLRWCQQDLFWRANILSPGALRKQFPRLLLRVDTPATSRSTTSRDERRRRRLAIITASDHPQIQEANPSWTTALIS